MPIGATAKQRIHVSKTRFTAEFLYIAAVMILAVFGMTADSHRPMLLVAGLLALPCGLAAIVGLYVLTGFFNWVAAGFSTSSVTHSVGGCTFRGHCWTRTWGTPVGARGFLFSACVVALFTMAALGNVLILRSAMRKRSGSPGAKA